MARPTLQNKNVRKLTRMGREGKSLGLTIPIEIAKELGWRERQKVVARRRGNELIIRDWDGG